MSVNQKRRIQVPCSDEHRAMLQAYADATGATLAAVCGQILEETAPIMGELAKTLAEARRTPAKAMRQVVDKLDEKLEEIDQMKLELEPKAEPKKGKNSRRK